MEDKVKRKPGHSECIMNRDLKLIEKKGKEVGEEEENKERKVVRKVT